MRLWTCRAFVFLYRNRSMNRSVWAIRRCWLRAVASAWFRRNSRWSTNASKSPVYETSDASSTSTTRVATPFITSRSCEISTTAPSYAARNPSSHTTDSRSRWLVGSSSSRQSGLASSSFASATRIIQPPDSSSTRLPRSCSRNPSPAQIFDASASSEYPPSCSNRAWRCPNSFRSRSRSSGSVVSSRSRCSTSSRCPASVMATPAESTSFNTVLPRSASVSCGRYPTTASLGTEISPPSGCCSPAIISTSVVFPAPFGPTKATRSRAPIRMEASRNSTRSPNALDTPRTSITTTSVRDGRNFQHE